MGTITFYELQRSGSPAQNNSQVAKLDDSLKRTQDATTSSSIESITLQDTTTILGVLSVEEHRIGTDSSLTNYIDTDISGQINWYGVTPGDVIYYRTDA